MDAAENHHHRRHEEQVPQEQTHEHDGDVDRQVAAVQVAPTRRHRARRALAIRPLKQGLGEGGKGRTGRPCGGSRRRSIRRGRD